MKNLIIASTSTVHDSSYLEYLLPELENHFNGCETILFIPYARPGGITYDDYTAKVSEAFAKINKKVKGIHQYFDPVIAIQNAEAIFTGGGNTFLLVHTLYEQELMQKLADVLENGTPYLGTSAGSNIAGVSMQTTNDMPIIYPPSFKTLGLFPFNLNPHYLDPVENSTHMGETRETRIKEYHKFNKVPVVGLREGSWLEIKGDTITLRGEYKARLFRQKHEAIELPTNELLSFL